MSSKEEFLKWLEKQANNPRAHLARFTTGGFIFVIGMMIVLIADHRMMPSLRQELTSLAGIGLIAIGLLHSMSGYLGLSVLRVLHFILSGNPDAETKEKEKNDSNRY